MAPADSRWIGLRYLCPMCFLPLTQGEHMMVKIDHAGIVISCYRKKKVAAKAGFEPTTT